jgi:tetraacyldisaccharide 4'-kinase
MFDLQKIWYQPHHPLSYLLLPFSALYRIVLWVKHGIYVCKIKKATYLPVPTIVVGNLTIGGTGKTPLIILLAHYLSQHGYKPGIISRGYGGKPRTLPLPVTPESDPLEAGDEPVLIAQKTGCPVVVDPHRVRAAQYLLANYACTILLSDDGLQHTALGRHIEIAIINGRRGFGNGRCLPAGPLREPIERLKNIDFVVVRQDKKNIKVRWPQAHAMQVMPRKPYHLLDPEKILPADWIIQKKVLHAVAGIAHPDAFFEQLRALGFSIIEHPFPDHHAYTAQDIDFGPEATIIMTEKDAVKLKKFARNNHWCLPVIAECDSMLPLLLRQILPPKNMS